MHTLRKAELPPCLPPMVASIIFALAGTCISFFVQSTAASSTRSGRLIDEKTPAWPEPVPAIVLAIAVAVISAVRDDVCGMEGLAVDANGSHAGATNL